MSISTVYDKIVDVIEATLPTHVRIPNAYDITANTFLHMKDDSYGLTIDSGFDTQRYVDCLITWQQSFTIVLIKRVVTTQNNMGQRETLEKGILTDWELLWKAFRRNPSLDQLAINADVGGNGGIQFIDGQQHKFLSMFVNLTVEHQDTY